LFVSHTHLQQRQVHSPAHFNVVMRIGVSFGQTPFRTLNFAITALFDLLSTMTPPFLPTNFYCFLGWKLIMNFHLTLLTKKTMKK
jgi:hypothetical protein